MDSQSAKSTGEGAQERGYDVGKQTKGRTHYVLLDIEGFLLKVKVHATDVFDRGGIKSLLENTKELFPRLSHCHCNRCRAIREKGKDWTEKVLGWRAKKIISAQEVLDRGT